jgi:hypothetical protein
MEFTGIARGVEFAQPSVIGRFFGNNAFLFTVNVDSPLTVAPNTELSFVPVRLECFLRVPNFEGQNVKVVGTYDSFDRVIEAEILKVPDNGLLIGAAKHFSIPAAVISIIAVVVLEVAAIVYLHSDYLRIKNDPNSGNLDAMLWMLATLSDLVLMLLVSAYLMRVAIAPIAQGFDRFFRRSTEYLEGAGKVLTEGDAPQQGTKA